MASKELSILLLAKDMASKTIGKVNKEIGKLGKTGAIASRGLTSLGANLAKVGAIAAIGIGAAVKSGISSLAELESAVTSVDGAITQLGLTGQITGSQVATWANEIEASTGAAFDDKAITQAAATLIRFGKVTPKNLRPAMEVMTDLATKTGSVDSAASLLAKALADPTKAAGKLARSGVILTKAQQDQIKAMVAAGKTAEAQTFILDELAKSTKGAALASQGPYARAMSTLRDITEDAQRALAEGFLPVLEKLAGKLSTAMSNPKFIEGIREFGKGLAGGLDSLISIAEKLPWNTIGTSLQIAGAGAKAILGAFVALPPWVQTAVLTGWGLNKLTGGALTGIVGELGKGLIKGVLGITAGTVIVKGPIVGAPGAGVPGGGGIGVSTILKGAAALSIGTLIGLGIVEGAKVLIDALDPTARTPEGLRGFTGPNSNRNPRDSSGRTRQEVAAANNKPVVLGPPSPAYAGVIERATARGLTPTKSGIQATLDKNARAAAIAQTRVGDRIASMTAAVNALRQKDFSPNVQFRLTVNTATTVSVRDQRIATAIHNSYQGRIPTTGRGPVAS